MPIRSPPRGDLPVIQFLGFPEQFTSDLPKGSLRSEKTPQKYQKTIFFFFFCSMYSVANGRPTGFQKFRFGGLLQMKSLEKIGSSFLGQGASGPLSGSGSSKGFPNQMARSNSQ